MKENQRVCGAGVKADPCRLKGTKMDGGFLLLGVDRGLDASCL